MRQYIITNNGFTFERISKKQARAAYENDLTIIITPVNLHPFNMYSPGININRKHRGAFVIDALGVVNDFYDLVNSFEYYNCNNETGLYSAYYIPVRYINRFTGEKQAVHNSDTVKEYDYKYMEVK